MLKANFRAVASVSLLLLAAAGCQQKRSAVVYELLPWGTDILRVENEDGFGYDLPRPANNGAGVNLAYGFPVDTKAFHARYRWGEGDHERWVELGPVPVEPWDGPVGEHGLEFEVIVGSREMSARLRPLYDGVRDEDERRFGFPRYGAERQPEDGRRGAAAGKDPEVTRRSEPVE